MSKLSVPVTISWDMDIYEYIKIFKEMNVDRVYLSFVERVPFVSSPKRDALMDLYRCKKKIFEDNGFETGVWITTLGFGAKIDIYNRESSKNYRRIVSISGNSCDDCICPTDQKFTDDICDFVREIAYENPGLIMIDDEFALCGVTGIGCACSEHMERYEKLLDESVNCSELASKIFTGEKNKYRTAWLKVQGDSLREFCRRLRETVDSINSQIRIGFCSGFTSWDLEGADAIELSRILAGNTRPFLRFTGAPYWYARKRFGEQMMQTIVEITRQQYEWCKYSGIEVFAEADSYPHTAWQVPTSYVEGFDLATKVSDNMDTLKYVVGYYAKPWYETGYISQHIKNMGLYEEIAEAFDDKEAMGIRIYHQMRIMEELSLPDEFVGEDAIRNWYVLNQASVLPTSHAVPTTYSGKGICGLVFGDHAKFLDEEAFENGLILDIKAALILKEKNIDTGIVSALPTQYLPVERFEEYNTDTFLATTDGLFDIEVSQNAKVLSYYVYEDIKTPSAYLYENKSGQKFLVYAFNAEKIIPQSGVITSTCRGKQLCSSIEWLSGKKLPAVCIGHPMLYCICKKNEFETAIGYFNYYADEIVNAQIEFSSKCKGVRFINCSGELFEDRAIIHNIKPFGFAGIVITD